MENINLLRAEFPILNTILPNGKELVYLDNASTTQKPKLVIDKLNNYYQTINANVHRGVHYLSEQATQAYDQARIKLQTFINAASPSECIFTKGTTESINLVAFSFGECYINSGDEIIISNLDHHANIVPWQLLCARKHAMLKIIPVLPNGELDLTKLANLISKQTKLIAVGHVSNALGTINPIKKIITLAHSYNIPVLIDGTQAPAHLPVDVQDLDCDFYTISAHKMYGPMGIGLLYGKEKWLEAMPPYQSGGDMILQVSLTKGCTFNALPIKFEAGTPNVAGAIGFAAAVDFLNSLDLARLWQYEQDLIQAATKLLIAEIPTAKIIGTAVDKISILSFTLENIHPHDIGTILNTAGIAIRAGHHCTMPLMESLGVTSTARASFAIYNTLAEVEYFINELQQVRKLLIRN